MRVTPGATTISAGTLRFTGSIAGLGSGIDDEATLAFRADRQRSTVMQTISGSGGLIQAGSAVLTLGAAETYSGGTTIQSGTLRLAAGASLNSAGALTINGGSFDLNGQSALIGNLSGTGGSIVLDSASNPLTVNETGTTSFAGIITGYGNLTVEGGGTLTLAGANNFYGGTTTITAGSTLDYTGDTSQLSAPIVDSGNLVFASAGNAILNYGAVISGTGTLTIASGTLTADDRYQRLHGPDHRRQRADLRQLR